MAECIEDWSETVNVELGTARFKLLLFINRFQHNQSVNCTKSQLLFSHILRSDAVNMSLEIKC